MWNIEIGSTVKAVKNRSRFMQPEPHLVGAIGRVTYRLVDGAGAYYVVEFDFGDSPEFDYLCENCLEVL